MTVIWIIVAALTAGILYVIWGIWKIGKPTTGPQIDLSARTETALLVIDMQMDFTALPAWTENDLQQSFAQISALTSNAQRSGMPVVVIRHVFRGWLANLLNGMFNKGRGNEGSDGLALDPSLNLTPNAEFVKSVGDAFSVPGLDQYLAEQNVGHLILTGLDGCHCVNKTAQGARNRGYQVTIDPAAVLAANPRHWSKVKDDLSTAGVKFT
ncbi:cysteine hydrolase [Tropicibacter sp. R16_0]|uniref:cysteine hydrolase n=1 Tax=Tropicibacter sp. R16_0 TaxID=2821102 RepID=UPI001ADA6A38|nr:cysteine hydrolase [Tropicibacter sp. R16_0]MBO9451834.1 cysteine hydrolase [Tropicibacter sp. R16_0]